MSTPEHAPPSAAQAERYIHDTIRPLSQVSEGNYLRMDLFKFRMKSEPDGSLSAKGLNAPDTPPRNGSSLLG